MTGLADDLLNLLRGHPLIEGVHVIEFDETPEGLKKVLAEVEKWLSRST